MFVGSYFICGIISFKNADLYYMCGLLCLWENISFVGVTHVYTFVFNEFDKIAWAPPLTC